MATATAKKTKIKFRPLDDRILVVPVEAEERTAGGIVLPDSAREKPQRGRVLCVGPGKLLDSGQRAEMHVSTGDEVLYGKYSGTEVDFEGEAYVVLRQTDVLAVVE
jgi:chaperonin GroES